jgi:anti-anti-sigma factor
VTDDHFSYDIVQSTDRTIIELRGEIDLANPDAVADALGKAADVGLPVVVDVTQLDFIDSAGFAAIHRLIERREVHLVVPPSARTSRAFGVSGLNEVLPIHPSRDDVRVEGPTAS